MPDFFDEMATVATDLLLPSDQGGLGARAGAVSFVRLTEVPAVEEWDVPTYTQATLDVRAQAFGVRKELIGTPTETGGAIVASDIYVIAERIPGGRQPTDLIFLDGKPVTILSAKDIPAVGTVSAHRFIVRA
ncbi:MAG: hypothetical protein ABW128_15500 [Rhizorhabdus sp.]